jgi:hypothetical protein
MLRLRNLLNDGPQDKRSLSPYDHHLASTNYVAIKIDPLRMTGPTILPEEVTQH